MNDLKGLKKKSKQGALLSGIGFFVIICSFLYATRKISAVNAQIKQKNIELDSLTQSVGKMNSELIEKSNKIQSFKQEISGLSISKTFIDKGLESYYSGDFKNAINYYDSAITKYQNSSSAYGLKGQAQIKIKQYTEAEENLLKSIRLNPERPQPIYSLVSLYVKKNDLEKAFFYLEKLLDITPHYINQIKFIPELNLLILNENFSTIQDEQEKKLIFVQRKLIELGYYKGQADCYFGEKTAKAIKDYQKDNDLTITGTWDLNTLNELGYK